MKQIPKSFWLGSILAFVFGGVFLLVVLGIPAQATDIGSNYGNTIGYSDKPLPDIVTSIINWGLGFLALVAVILIIYGGIIWMTAAGNEEKVSRAKKIILSALIGLVIILLSWAIVWFVLRGVTNGNINNGEPGGETPPGGDSGGSTDFYVQWVSPTGDNEPTCTIVQAEFNDPVDTNSVINNFSLSTCIGCPNILGTFEFGAGNTVMTFTPDSDLQPFQNYIIDFPNTIVRASDGEELTPRTEDFTTSGEEDIDPPKVYKEGLWPLSQSVDVCSTTPIMAAFNEPMNVLSLNFDNVAINPIEPAGLGLTGLDVIDPYTMVFHTNVPMSHDTTYDLTLKSSDLNPTGPLTDVCGNPLDGNEDGLGGDSFPQAPVNDWYFTTGITDDCPPFISSMTSSGYYEDTITINGENFIGGSAYFFDQIEVNQGINVCLDEDNMPWGPCILPGGWTNEQISVKVPAMGGVSTNGADDGPVYIKVGENTSNSKDFDVKSPYITEIAPGTGAPVGQTITLMGKNFGNSPGHVYFRVPPDGLTEVAGLEPECDNWWSDEQILITVPSGLNLGPIYIQIETSGGSRSHIYWTFNIISGNPGPVICELNPTCRNNEGDPVTVEGYGFGTTADTVVFGTTSATINNWSENSIDTQVPSIPDSEDPYLVWVRIGTAWSNGMQFNKPCSGSGGPGGETHAACAGNDCITVSGSGADECSVSGDCTGSNTHSECDGLNCIIVAGPGTNECSTPEDCAGSEDTHAACAGNECITASGPGADECSGPEDCTGSDTHSECSGSDCNVVAGPGINECSEPDDCSGSGAPCDDSPETPECEPIACENPDEYCRESDCTCRLGSPCDSTPETPECNPDITMCDADEYCNEDCICRQGDPCDGELGTAGCQPEATMCDNPEHQCNPNNCYCLPPPDYSCSLDTWTCDPNPIACPADQGCTNSCVCTDRPVIIERAPEGPDICRNAVLDVTFDQTMRTSTINSDTVQVYLTAGGAEGAVCANNIDCRSDLCTGGVCVGNSVSGTFANISGSRFQYRMGILEKNINYTVEIQGGEDGVLNSEGIGMQNDPVTWTFTTLDSDNVCKINKVIIEPGYHLFTYNDETQDYQAFAYYNNQLIYGIPDIYDWSWNWASEDETIITVTGSTTDQETGTADNKNGETEITATATVTVGGDEEISGTTRVEVQLCENPWPTTGAPLVDNDYNFSVWYCMDNGLPALPDTPIVSDGPEEVLREYFFTGLKVCQGTKIDCSNNPDICGDSALCETLEDVIGIRIMPNPEKYSPLLWFESNLPGEDPGSAQPKEIDGYPAIKVGRTNYIAATNLSGGLWANMNLISIDDEANTITQDIYNEMVKNIRFNINIDETIKAQLRNDMARIANLNDNRNVIEDYYIKNQYYPSLEVGSYLVKRSTSAWPSWQATLGNELGRSLSVDPSNAFNIEFCPIPQFDQSTCWRDDRENFPEEGGQFICQPESNVLMYKYSGSGNSCDGNPDTIECDFNSEACPIGEACNINTCTCQNVELYCNFEYTGAGGWNTGSYNPCSDTISSTCNCYNYQEIFP